MTSILKSVEREEDGSNLEELRVDMSEDWALVIF